MSTDWETTLTSWVKPASETEETKKDRTEKLINDALNDDAAIKDMPINVYAKGSYKNRTNVRADSDVDINVEYHGIHYYKFENDLEGKTAADFDWTGTSGDEPSPAELKNLVESAMEKAFGSTSVTRKNKAIEVHEQNNSLAADVVPCFTFHNYSFLDSYGNPSPFVGTKLFPDSGLGIVNWPEQHYKNGVAKNKAAATTERFKKMVRCLKRLENQMVKEGVANETPSYLIECLVYNVPNQYFGHATYFDDLELVVAHILTETDTQEKCSDWVEVNELKYLFGSHQKWNRQDARDLASAAWSYMGFGE